MSNRVSFYQFKEYEDRQAAADKIHYNCGGHDAYETNDGYCDYEHSYGLFILSDCTNVNLAVQYCEGHRGKLKSF
jgi:hypothetical protein